MPASESDLLLIHEFLGQTDVRGGDLHLDPATSTDADFLAREKAALGDDADFFATANDDVPTDNSTNAAAANNNNNQSGDFDLLGGDVDAGDGGTGDGKAAGGGGAFDDDDGGMADFQSSFPALNAGNSVWANAPLIPLTSLFLAFFPHRVSFLSFFLDSFGDEVSKSLTRIGFVLDFNSKLVLEAPLLEATSRSFQRRLFRPLTPLQLQT